MTDAIFVHAYAISTYHIVVLVLNHALHDSCRIQEAVEALEETKAMDADVMLSSAYLDRSMKKDKGIGARSKLTGERGARGARLS